MGYLADGSSAGVPPTFLEPDRLYWSSNPNWPYFVWLSPTVEHVISLAQATDSVSILKSSRLDCIHAAFAKGCPVFFDEILKFFGGKAQGRLEWTTDKGINPGVLPFSDFRLLVRATLQNGDRLLLDSFLKLADPSRPVRQSSKSSLGDILLEGLVSGDKPDFEYMITSNTVTNAISSRKYWEGMLLLDRLLREALKNSPAQRLKWLLDLLSKDCLVSAIEKAWTSWELPQCNPFQVFMLGGTSPRHLGLKAGSIKAGNELWIIPALLRQDREIVGLFLDRGLGQLHPLRLNVMQRWSSSWRDIPPNGMPDLPLYCAIFLAFNPKFILFLCERGSSISDSARSEQPQPAIIEHLISLLTVDQARQSFKSANELIGGIFDAERLNLEELSLWESRDILSLNIARGIAREFCPWFAEVAQLRGGSRYDSPSVEAEMPSPLQTQGNWDEWRAEVLRILREYHAKSHGA